MDRAAYQYEPAVFGDIQHVERDNRDTQLQQLQRQSEVALQIGGARQRLSTGRRRRSGCSGRRSVRREVCDEMVVRE